MNHTKRISIVMCTYNGAAYLSEQLDSLLRQTYPFYELIVQDDRSTDATADIIRHYQQQYPDRRISLFVNEQRLNYNRNFLTAVRRATGDYIAYSDQDDIWFDNKLEVLMQEIGDAPMVFCNSVMIDNERREHGLSRRFSKPHPTLYSLFVPYVIGHATLFTPEVQSRLKLLTDNHLYVRYEYLTQVAAAGIGPIRYYSEPLVYWRRHEAAATIHMNKKTNSAGWRGYAKALQVCGNAATMTAVRHFFTRILLLPFRDATVAQAVRYMSKGKLLRTGLLCLRHNKDAAPDATGLTRRLRAFFRPMFFVRDSGWQILNY